MKERINYVFDKGVYVGLMVNSPLVCEADSLPELESKMKVLLIDWIEMLTDVNKNPFEMVEVTKEEWMKK